MTTLRIITASARKVIRNTLLTQYIKDPESRLSSGPKFVEEIVTSCVNQFAITMSTGNTEKEDGLKTQCTSLKTQINKTLYEDYKTISKLISKYPWVVKNHYQASGADAVVQWMSLLRRQSGKQTLLITE